MFFHFIINNRYFFFLSISKVPVVMCAEDDCFPGLYCPNILPSPWLSDGCTMIIPSIWHSSQVLLSVNVSR